MNWVILWVGGGIVVQLAIMNAGVWTIASRLKGRTGEDASAGTDVAG